MGVGVGVCTRAWQSAHELVLADLLGRSQCQQRRRDADVDAHADARHVKQCECRGLSSGDIERVGGEGSCQRVLRPSKVHGMFAWVGVAQA